MEIFFDKSYEELLRELIVETVWLSGGLENINRAYIPHIYRSVTGNGTRFPLAFSGIGADAIFRGHVPTPNGLSCDMDRSHKSGRISIDSSFLRSAVGSKFEECYSCVEQKMKKLVDDYGEFGGVDSYFGYEIYEGLPRYFNGELMISNNFTSIRIPFLDPGMIRLACEIDLSVFALWRFVNNDRYRESYLQASLLARHPKLSRVRLEGLPLIAFTCRNKMLYNLMRVAYKGPKKLLSIVRGEKYVPLENWALWYKTVLREELDRRLAPDSRIAQYVEPNFISAMREKGEIHWIKILATLDIALELAENKWRLPGS